MDRRLFLKSSLVAAEIAVAASAGLLIPVKALAKWSAEAFNTTEMDVAMSSLFAEAKLEPSDAIQIEAPEVAENGRSVPVKISSTIEGAQTITVIVEKNPNPLIARFHLTPHIDTFIASRVKMAETGEVMAVISANGRHYAAKRKVVVTVGGCA